MAAIRLPHQRYWFSPRLPWLECRSTWHSQQPYHTHQHPQFSLGCMLEGVTCCHYRDGDFLLNAGELVLIEPDTAHSCNPLPGQHRSYYMLYLDKTWCLHRLAALWGQPVSDFSCDVVTINHPDSYARMLRLINHLHQGQLPQAETELRRLTDTLFMHYCRPVAPTMPYSPTTRYVQQRLSADLLAAPPLTTLATELDLRRETVLRQFRRDTGITPLAYLNNMRIEYAKSLIKQGAELADTGYASGFCDQSHFHRTFLQYTAATPGQYRQGRSLSCNT
ncbi:AraC family transcriptional regulator [Musicola paradisiaca]|uniref:Transcriptional regulator, AraC family n=1 Tax=Musicola paradisiaca (strain Ech703) TaxID=579405 RepID=C6C8L5_MUSP7|nr:AraC family transcriptional regulator [Musicola paradisiaca]ACS86181.1 transcriptional regulator, AraC family [Musicola paradisiaca Ech703]